MRKHCSDCGHKMHYVKDTKKGEKYECEQCGSYAYMKGMKEDKGPVDTEAFGF